MIRKGLFDIGQFLIQFSQDLASKFWKWRKRGRMDLGLDDAQYRTAYVSFSAEINVTTTEQLIATTTQIIAQGFNRIYFLFCTPGGNVMNGMNLYNVLRGLPAKIVFHNVGNVDSIGNAIFLAGDERYACPHSTFMFHGVGFDITTQMRLEQKNLQEFLGGLLADQGRIAQILVDRTNIDLAEANDLFKEARTKDAAYAATKGIVSNIRDVHIPPGSSVFSLVFQR
jgi:ATP-dependent protease ClpP protease subunit